MTLSSAHRGYEYQDLLVATRLVDVLLNSVQTVHVDEKLQVPDLFDDLTTMDESGVRERVQIKHSSKSNQHLELRTFITDARRLRLDRIVSSILPDIGNPGIDTRQSSYRIILTDTPPTDPQLCSILKPATPDPGPFIDGLETVRMRFDTNAVLAGTELWPDANNPFEFLRDCASTASHADLEWIFDRLTVELNAPVASFDLTNPNEAERLLLRRVRRDVGAEVYPNADRSAVDVAAALIGSARAARLKSMTISASELLRRAQLRNDFGAVVKANPVDESLKIHRSTIVNRLVEEATDAAASARVVLLVGSPGQGKSWLCQQLVDKLTNDNWLVAEHYCYLGDANGERMHRAKNETVIGSLMRRLTSYDSDLLSMKRPILAADEQALIEAINVARSKWNSRPIALIVDGIDHVTRVIGGSSIHDPSLLLTETLASLRLPAGSTLIVSSQPGTHLKPLESAGAVTVQVPSLNSDELRELAQRIGVLGNESEVYEESLNSPKISDMVEENQFVQALLERSSGNALYATYLCRETLSRKPTVLGPVATVRRLPDYDGSLTPYYEYIRSSLGAQCVWVADVIALVDFPVSGRELKEMRPEMAHRVDEAVETLRPVVIEQATSSGIRIYHESFARSLREPFKDDENSRIALLNTIIKWLRAKGLMTDSRAYRHLLRLLAEANCDQQVVDEVGPDFVIESIAAGFPASQITKNLATAVRSATLVNDWGAVARCVEMSRSLETYEMEERFESTLERFEDVIVPLLGAEIVAQRLLHDGFPTVSTRSGLRICSVLDAAGAVAPWSEFMLAYLKQEEEDTIDSDYFEDRVLDVALLRGRLRLSSHGHLPTTSSTQDQESLSWRTDRLQALYSPVNWDRLVEHLDEADLPAKEVVDVILDTFGLPTAAMLVQKLAQKGVFCLALAEALVDRSNSHSENDPRKWALRAVEYGLPFGFRWRLFALGLDVDEVEQQPIAEARSHLLQLTREIQDPLKCTDGQTVREWMDVCCVAAKRDRLGLAAAEALLEGTGWYRCWLRFVITLVLCEASTLSDRSPIGLSAIRILREQSDPFIGDPRACDLLPLHGLINETIHRTVSVLDDHDWCEAIEILDAVSQDISTTMSGEIGGPVDRHSLMNMTVDTLTPQRLTKAQELVDEEIENGGFGNYYADLAQNRMLYARLALAAGSESKARTHWSEACQLLLGYGSHKDSTIYELIDPLRELIGVDPKQGRQSVAKLQPLCEHVLFHTDGRGTRHVRSDWWTLLAKADPCALTRLIEPTLLGSCNDPNWLMQAARADLWRIWHDRADPLVAGALRLTLDEALDPNDIAAMRRLTALCGEAQRNEFSKLLDVLLARADERPYKYHYGDGREQLDRDTKLINELNSIASSSNASQIAPLPRVEAEGNSLYKSKDRKRKTKRLSLLPVGAYRFFDEGADGIRQAIHAWRERRFDESDVVWSVQRFANILGYRMLELAGQGRQNEVEDALESLGGTLAFDKSAELLEALAEGFERYGHCELASAAFTLAWTRTNGAGGWRAFGGKTRIDSLRRAVGLNRHIALRKLSREVEHVVSRGSGTLGITQSLIYGFAKGGLASSCSLAFDIWGEAHQVIALRTPRLGCWDDPDLAYQYPDPDVGDDPPGCIDSALASAVLAGLFHPGREHKRRALVAIQLLVEHRPSIVAPAINSALLLLSDHTTLTWLLQSMRRAGSNLPTIVSTCRDSLIELAGRPQLVVRTLARDMLANDEASLPPVTDLDPELVDEHAGLIVPASSNNHDKESADLEAVIDEITGLRLSRAETILPGLRQAVIRRVAETQTGEEYKRRSKAQFESYGDSWSKRIPDAFLTLDEAIEDAIQNASSGARVARVMNGNLSSDPLKLEDSLSQVLLDAPESALAFEFARKPRPEIPPPPYHGDRVWHRLCTCREDGATDESGVESESQQPKWVIGTLSISESDRVPIICGGPYKGWRLVASHERREIPNPDRNIREQQIAERFRVIELRNHGDKQALTSPPITVGDPNVWNVIPVPAEFLNRCFPSQPVVGLIRPTRHGLGMINFLLTPTQWLVAALGIEHGTQLALDDEMGRALALITWRTEYETSDHFLAWPRLCGSGLAVRPDAFDRLVQTARGQLKFRDFVGGNSSLSG